MAERNLSTNKHAVYMREWFSRPGNRKRQVERAQDWQAKTRADVQRLFAEFRASGCVVCGEAHPACLDAHHVLPDEKEFRVWAWRRIGLSPTKVQAELAKCVCICANCHRKLHHADHAAAKSAISAAGVVAAAEIWTLHAGGS